MRKRKVKCTNLTTKKTKIYDSISEASEEIDTRKSVAMSAICNCCKGNMLTAYGFKWEYVNDYGRSNEN